MHPRACHQLHKTQSSFFGTHTHDTNTIHTYYLQINNTHTTDTRLNSTTHTYFSQTSNTHKAYCFYTRVYTTHHTPLLLTHTRHTHTQTAHNYYSRTHTQGKSPDEDGDAAMRRMGGGSRWGVAWLEGGVRWHKAIWRTGRRTRPSAHLNTRARAHVFFSLTRLRMLARARARARVLTVAPAHKRSGGVQPSPVKVPPPGGSAVRSGGSGGSGGCGGCGGQERGEGRPQGNVVSLGELSVSC